MTIIRMQLSIASSFNYYISLLDINITFLHGDLEEEDYRKCPLGLKVFTNLVSINLTNQYMA